MLHHKPKFNYIGLTIILSQPSRYDDRELLNSNSPAGYFISSECLAPETNRYQIDIRTRFLKEPLLPDTKVVLLLGEGAFKQYLPELAQGNHLGEIRGSPYLKDGIVYIVSFTAQDAIDPQDYESRLNPFLKILGQGAGGDYSATASNPSLETAIEDKSDPTIDKRRHGKTDRANYRFWLRADIKKCLRIINNNGIIPPTYAQPNYIISPNALSVINMLSNVENEYLDFDMETYSDNYNITCFSYSVGDSNDVYVVPIYRHDWSLAYDKITLCKIFRALALAIQRNILVAHNGSGFDYLVLAHRYRIAIGKVYDTMIAAHRCYPEIEKSLGHWTSLVTYEPFHKDESAFFFSTAENARKQLLYCGKDVFTMKLIRKWQIEYAKTQPGLTESIAQAQASIKPYMITSLLGIKYNEQKVVEILAENDRLANQYLRCLRLLTGRHQLLPTSNKECIDYFHTQLGYPIQHKSKKTGKPSLSEKHLLKLRLKFNNPAIDFCLRYRQTIKESGSLKFTPWNDK